MLSQTMSGCFKLCFKHFSDMVTNYVFGLRLCPTLCVFRLCHTLRFFKRCHKLGYVFKCCHKLCFQTLSQSMWFNYCVRSYFFRLCPKLWFQTLSQTMFSDFVTNSNFWNFDTNYVFVQTLSHTKLFVSYIVTNNVLQPLSETMCVFRCCHELCFQTLAQTSVCCFRVCHNYVFSSDFGTNMCSDFVTEYVWVVEFVTNTVFYFRLCHKLVFFVSDFVTNYVKHVCVLDLFANFVCSIGFNWF